MSLRPDRRGPHAYWEVGNFSGEELPQPLVIIKGINHTVAYKPAEALLIGLHIINAARRAMIGCICKATYADGNPLCPCHEETK